MLALIPKTVPPLSTLLDDLGNPSAAKLAAVLGVSVRSVRRWIATDDAPYPVRLALFWVTRWGYSMIHCDAHNQATMYAGLVGALKTEARELRSELGRVLALGDTGAANGASWRHLPVASVTPLHATA